MRGTYCYLPILRARWGAFHAVGALSPIARSRLTPMFDVAMPVFKNAKPLEDYLTERAQGIHQSWGPLRPVYVDVHDLPPELRTSSGAQPITYLLDIVLDFRYIGNRSPDALRAILLEAMQVIHRIGEFRNLAIIGSSVPQALGKNTLGEIRRERRVEYGLWTQLATTLSDQMTIVPGDHGVLYAHYVPRKLCACASAHSLHHCKRPYILSCQEWRISGDLQATGVFQ